jgi:hypothetical protein
MKSHYNITGTILIVLFIFLIHSCKKEKVPTLTTTQLTNISGNTATSRGTITDEGSGTVISRGVCWGTGIDPTIADNKTTDGAGAGSFTSKNSGQFSPVADEVSQKQFYTQCQQWSDLNEVPIFYFEAFNERWKGATATEAETNWGFYYADRTPKLVFQEGK